MYVELLRKMTYDYNLYSQFGDQIPWFGNQIPWFSNQIPQFDSPFSSLVTRFLGLVMLWFENVASRWDPVPERRP